jgi:hypothetical protein
LLEAACDPSIVQIKRRDGTKAFVDDPRLKECHSEEAVFNGKMAAESLKVMRRQAYQDRKMQGKCS